MPIGKVAHSSSSSLVDWQRRTARPMNDRQLPQLSASISTNDRQLHGTAVQHGSKKFATVFPLQQRRKGTSRERSDSWPNRCELLVLISASNGAPALANGRTLLARRSIRKGNSRPLRNDSATLI